MAADRLILVTNDDGIFAKGIKTLAEEMRAFGRVVVVAPDKPQSAMGHAITIHSVIRFNKVHMIDGVDAWSCSGTPVDCVKLALYHLLEGQTPDLIVSGVNHGLNASINVLYSGTMSAAVEGAIERIPSIGFSLLDHSADADMDHCRGVIRTVTKNVIDKGITPKTTLNVNIPRKESGKLKGVKVCVQADANWEDGFEIRTDPAGKEYAWLTGRFVEKEHDEKTDMWALNNGFASVVPVQFDMTAYSELETLSSWSYEI